MKSGLKWRGLLAWGGLASLSVTLISYLALKDAGNSLTQAERAYLQRQGSPGKTPAPPQWRFERALMGTHFKLLLVGGEAQAAAEAAEHAFKEVARVEARLSSWRPNSEISALNRNAGGDLSPLSSETLALLREAKEIALRSRGAFDPTWAAFKGLWDFRAQRLPSREAIHRARALVSYRALELDLSGERARLARAGMSIDLGAIGKGYAIDRAALALKMAGWRNFTVDGGGDLYLSGRPSPERRWRIGVRHPRARKRVLFSLSLEDQAVATSGDYERFFFKNGQRFHHIIDLRTGYPAQGAVSVTLIGDRALLVDAWATALMVLGPREGLPLLEEQSGLYAVMMTREGQILKSQSLPISFPSRWRGGEEE
ncbi:MAG: FAD:protein FMN transferase [Myxococcota bacterium]|nr:FAD:protein FMN transferase [Myxococcota bacterium]